MAVKAILVTLDDGTALTFNTEWGDRITWRQTDTYTGTIDKPTPVRYFEALITPAQQPTELRKG